MNNDTKMDKTTIIISLFFIAIISFQPILVPTKKQIITMVNAIFVVKKQHIQAKMLKNIAMSTQKMLQNGIINK